MQSRNLLGDVFLFIECLQTIVGSLVIMQRDDNGRTRRVTFVARAQLQLAALAVPEERPPLAAVQRHQGNSSGIRPTHACIPLRAFLFNLLSREVVL